MRATQSQTEKRLYEFGAFRLDAQTRVLEKDGQPLSLAPKALDVLIVLVENRGRLVEKEDLMSQVWPETYVEENNLAFNVSVLRKALGESVAAPQFIETVPKRGYRFIGDVVVVPEVEAPSTAEVIRPVDVEPTPKATHGVTHGVIQGATHRAGVQKRLLRNRLVLVVATLAVIGSVTYFLRGTTTLTDRDVIVLAAFVNTTGDPVFDETLQQGLAVQLEQSPYLSLLSEQRVRRTLPLMRQASDARLTPELAREVCERTGSSVTLEGSIARVGTRYVLGLRAKNCSAGEMLDDEQTQVDKKEEVLDALTRIARQFRARAGESRATLRGHDVPLAEATTQSLDALKAYSAAWQIHESQGATAALPLFQRATELDPDFAMAHASLGRIYADLDISDMAAESITRAWLRRDRLSDREKFFIGANYQILVTGDLEEARKTGEAWARTYPRDATPHLLASGMVNKVPGRFEEAAAEASKAISLDPDFGIGYYNLAVNRAYLGRLDEADEELHRAAARGLDVDEFWMLAYDLAFLRRDARAMEHAAVQARAKPGPQSWIPHRQAFAQASLGCLRASRTLSQQAVAQAQHDGQTERAGLWEAGAAVRDALLGDAAGARERAGAALKRCTNRDVEFGAGFALSYVGDASGTQRLVDDLERRYPNDMSVQFSYVPVLRARLALAHGEAAKAISLLRLAAVDELGIPRSAVSGLFGALYPVYVRGQAFLVLGKGAEAAAEFRKILDHRGIVVCDPIGALAHLQLGRALALAGEDAAAQMAYRDFLELWKDADPDLPLLLEARAEYAKVRRR